MMYLGSFSVNAFVRFFRMMSPMALRRLMGWCCLFACILHCCTILHYCSMIDAWMLTSVARCGKESMNLSYLFLFIEQYIAFYRWLQMLQIKYIGYRSIWPSALAEPSGWRWREIWLVIEGTLSKVAVSSLSQRPRWSFEGKCLQVFGCHSIAWSMKAMLPYVTFICILYSESRCSPHARVAWVNLANFSYEWAKSFLFVMYRTVYSVSYQDPNVASPPTSLFQQGSLRVTSTKHLVWVIPAACHTLIHLSITYVCFAISPKDVRRLNASAIPYSTIFYHMSASLLPLAVAFAHTPVQLGHLSGHVPQKTIRQERFKLWAEKDWPRRPRSEGYVVLAQSCPHSSLQEPPTNSARQRPRGSVHFRTISHKSCVQYFE